MSNRRWLDGKVRQTAEIRANGPHFDVTWRLAHAGPDRQNRLAPSARYRGKTSPGLDQMSIDFSSAEIGAININLSCAVGG